MKRAHGPDINYWTEPYKDDNIDEGTQMDFVIIKAADGKYDYLDSDNFKARYDSIKHVKVKGFFQYYRTKYSPEDNAATIIKVINSGLFEFGSLDFEGT
ncbi:MAG: hypothetical protein KAS32_17165, partial [Candidatus Peribacteraceae bacterium]|nr:hypothetical protein [Candidatus Peribacteraceae bacterium]